MSLCIRVIHGQVRNLGFKTLDFVRLGGHLQLVRFIFLLMGLAFIVKDVI